MALGLGRFLKQTKGRLTFLLLCLLVLPLFLLYTVWLNPEFQWWNTEQWTGNGEKATISDNSAESEGYFENLDYQLKNVRCPARVGLELRDYWKCLWRTSITAEGMRQHEKIIWNNYVNQVKEDLKTANQSRKETLHIKKGNMKRVRRQSIRPRPPTPEEEFIAYKGDAIFNDLYLAYTFHRKDVVNCLHKIYPGVSIQDFLYCVRKQAAVLEKNPPPGSGFAEGGVSVKNATLQTTTYPSINITYNSREFPLLEMVDRFNTTYKFSLEFQPLGDEEKQSNFFGADPYLDDDFSPYRYRYDNLNFQQRQPSWTYRGLHGSKDWHNLELDKFLLPLRKITDLKKETLTNEFPETYPGIGELANELKVEAPLDYRYSEQKFSTKSRTSYSFPPCSNTVTTLGLTLPLNRWTKSSGYTAYTRFLLPLLQTNDLAYYKSKKLIKSDVQLEPPENAIARTLDALYNYKVNSNDPAGKADSDETVPFVKAYMDFASHFFQFNMQKYHLIKQRYAKNKNKVIYSQLEALRLVIRSYVEVVFTQLVCLYTMLKLGPKDHRLETSEEIQELINETSTRGCKAKKNSSEAYYLTFLEKPNYPPDPVFYPGQYVLPFDKAEFLYKSYYDRIDARRRYSLPKYPIEFPICKHNDPSPIDIQTKQGRQSSIRDYTFGHAAYRLNRFFMFFPMDSSTLLTVGIVDGERLDDSSVRLTGGAVRGQNLTFQYMHIRFAHKWDMIGSEHLINGKGSSMELQMVFTISGSADPIKYWHILARLQNQIFQFRDKLVIILAVLVDVLETDQAVKDKINDEKLNQDPYLFEALAQAAYHFWKMPQVNPTYEEPRGYVSTDPVFRFIDFIPRKSTNFYTYRGSLSWPPCFAYVLWSVYEQRLYMSKRQFDEFVRIPANGIHTNNYAHDNVRKFEDIYVEEEHDPRLTYFEIDALKKHRTVDRLILTGHHHVEEDGDEDYRDDAIVGEEIYLLQEENGSGNLRLKLVGGALLNFNLISVLIVLLLSM